MKAKTYSEAKSMLPIGQKLALGGWYEGIDMKVFIPSRMTFHRYRKNILNITGIDIALPYVQQAPGAAAVLLGMDELLGREVKNVPLEIQRSLFGAGI